MDHYCNSLPVGARKRLPRRRENIWYRTLKVAKNTGFVKILYGCKALLSNMPGG
jgi:hypothetical protein